MNRITRALINQFSRPSGFFGHIAGWIMSTRTSNLDRNQWTVDLLDIKPTDSILEIGPGPGVTLGLLLSKAIDGKIVAVDHSATMLRQCALRNRAAVRDKRLCLVEASYTALPELGSFDKIIAVNSLQFSGNNDETLGKLAALLNPGGEMAITFQPRGSAPTNEKGEAFMAELNAWFSEAGLMTRCEILPMQPINAFCLLARRET